MIGFNLNDDKKRSPMLVELIGGGFQHNTIESSEQCDSSNWLHRAIQMTEYTCVLLEILIC